MTASNYFELKQPRNAAFRLSLRESLQELRERRGQRQRMHEVIEQRKQQRREQEASSRRSIKLEEAQRRKEQQVGMEKRVQDQLRRMRASQSAPTTPARGTASPRARGSSPGPASLRSMTPASYDVSPSNSRQEMAEEHRVAIQRRKQRDEEVKAVLTALKQVTMLETTSATARNLPSPSVDEAIRRLKELDEARMHRLVSSQIVTPSPKPPSSRRSLVPRCATAPTVTGRSLASSRLSTDKAHRVKTMPHAAHGGKFRQPDFTAAVASDNDATFTPSARIGATSTVTSRSKPRSETRRHRPGASRPSAISARHVSFNSSVDVHVVEPETPSPSANISFDATDAGSINMTPPLAAPSNDDAPVVPPVSSPISQPTFVARSRIVPTVITSGPESEPRMPSPTQAVEDVSHLSASQPHIIEPSLPVESTSAPPAPATMDIPQKDREVDAETVQQTNGSELQVSPADEASRRRQTLIAEAEKRVKALRERQQAEGRGAQIRERLELRSSIERQPAATTDAALQAKIDAKLAAMRAANVSGSVSTPTPASATVSPALSENAELVAQLDSRDRKSVV